MANLGCLLREFVIVLVLLLVIEKRNRIEYEHERDDEMRVLREYLLAGGRRLLPREIAPESAFETLPINEFKSSNLGLPAMLNLCWHYTRMEKLPWGGQHLNQVKQ